MSPIAGAGVTDRNEPRGPAVRPAAAPVPPTSPIGRPDPPTRSWTRIRRGSAALCAALVLAATGTGWLTLRDLTGTSAATAGSRAADGSSNILLIGLDTRLDQNGNPLPAAVLDQLHAGDGDDGGYNTNTLILLHVPADGGKVTAFSIPRDDLVPIPGYRSDKIKQAYGVTKATTEDRLRAQGVSDPTALEQRGREAGRRATVGVVQTLTGLTVDHYAEITLAGFFDLAGALGGVPVCLDHAVSDSYSGAHFPAGVQTLNGAQSLAFVRQRHGLTNGDLDRTHRQQAFLSSAMRQVTGAGTWTNPAKISALFGVAERDVVLDQGWDALSFAAQASNLTGGDAAFYTLPITGYTQAHDEDDNLVDPVEVQSFIRTTIAAAAAPPPAPAPAPPDPAAAAGTTVSVDNASGIDGRAAEVVNQLVAHGFSPGSTATLAPRTTSSVLAAPGDQAAAALAAALLGPGVSPGVDPSLAPRHLRVVLGTEHHPSTPPGGPPGPAGAPVTAGGVPCVD